MFVFFYQSGCDLCVQAFLLIAHRCHLVAISAGTSPFKTMEPPDAQPCLRPPAPNPPPEPATLRDPDRLIPDAAVPGHSEADTWSIAVRLRFGGERPGDADALSSLGDTIPEAPSTPPMRGRLPLLEQLGPAHNGVSWAAGGRCAARAASIKTSQLVTR